MQTYTVSTITSRVLADTITPVSAYLRLREFFPSSVLLESSDYHAHQNSFSYIGCDVIAKIELQDGVITESFPDGSVERTKLEKGRGCLQKALEAFISRFQVAEDSSESPVINGLYGFLSYDAVEYMEDISLRSDVESAVRTPQMYYVLYRYVLAIDHYRNELYIQENICSPSSQRSSYDVFKLASKPDFS